MNDLKYFKGTIEQNKYNLILSVSLLFFIRKGIQYALIESYVPLITIVCMLLLLSWSLWFKRKLQLVHRLWSILLITWSTVRILLVLANFFLHEISNAHIYHQIGVEGSIVSLTFTCIGVYLHRKAKAYSI